MSMGMVYAEGDSTTEKLVIPSARYFSTEDYLILESLFDVYSELYENYPTAEKALDSAEKNITTFIENNKLSEEEIVDKELVEGIESRINTLSNRGLRVEDKKELENILKRIEYRGIKLTKDMSKKLNGLIEVMDELQKLEDELLEKERIEKLMRRMPRLINRAERNETPELIEEVREILAQLNAKDNQVKGWQARFDILVDKVEKQSAEEIKMTLDKFLAKRNLIASDWSKEFVFKANELKLLTGTRMYKNHNLTEDITRAEFVELMMNFVESSISAERLNLIKMNSAVVAYEDTAQDTIIEATKLGLVAGVGGNKFAPQDMITREQVAVILDRAMKIVDLENSYDVRQDIELALYSDAVLISDWAKQGVANMTAVGAIEGNGVGMFMPKGLTTKEQAIKIIVELMM